MNQPIQDRRTLDKKVRLFRRQAHRLNYAVYGRMEALERRVHLSSATIYVNGNGDDNGTNTPTGSGPYEADTLRDAVKFANNQFACQGTVTYFSNNNGHGQLLRRAASGSLHTDSRWPC